MLQILVQLLLYQIVCDQLHNANICCFSIDYQDNQKSVIVKL